MRAVTARMLGPLAGTLAEPGTAEVQVGASLVDVVQDDGRCTLAPTAGDGTVSAASVAVPDVAVSAALTVEGSRVSTGRWTPAVEHTSRTSRTSTGRSAAVEIEVP